MHTSFIATVALSFPALAIATVVPRDDCSTGQIKCCNSTMTNNATNLKALGGLLGLDLPSVSGLIGLSCSPLSILGAGGNSCSAQPVCCSNNSFGGIIALGCSPINLNL